MDHKWRRTNRDPHIPHYECSACKQAGYEPSQSGCPGTSPSPEVLAERAQIRGGLLVALGKEAVRRASADASCEGARSVVSMIRSALDRICPPTEGPR